MGCRNRYSCRIVFKILNIFPLKLQCIFSLIILIIINNNSYFTTNADNHNILNRQRNNLLLPQANLASFQKGPYYSGIKIFNNRPTEIKDLSDNHKKFKNALKHFYIHSPFILRMNNLTEIMSFYKNTICFLQNYCIIMKRE